MTASDPFRDTITAMHATPHTLSMVLPFFNEKEYLPYTVERALAVLERLSPDYELILVNDGSTDESPDLASTFAQTNPRIKVISHPRNMGLGAALRSGFSGAQNEILIYTDMDCPFDLQLLLDYVPMIERYDFIYGIRKGNREGFQRMLFGACYNHLIRFIFGIDNPDINFALKIFRRELLSHFQLDSDGSFVDAELFLKVSRLNRPMGSVEVPYQPRQFGESHLGNFRNIFNILRELGSMIHSQSRQKSR